MEGVGLLDLSLILAKASSVFRYNNTQAVLPDRIFEQLGTVACSEKNSLPGFFHEVTWQHSTVQVAVLKRGFGGPD